jgi:hypothetical protein
MTIKNKMIATLTVLILFIAGLALLNHVNQSRIADKTAIALALSDANASVLHARLFQRYSMMEPTVAAHAAAAREHLQKAKAFIGDAHKLMVLTEAKARATRHTVNIRTDKMINHFFPNQNAINSELR